MTTRDGTVASGDQAFSDVIPPPNGGGGGGGPGGGNPGGAAVQTGGGTPAATLTKVVITKTTLLYTLDHDARLTLRIQRMAKGRRKGRTCSTTARHGKPCTTLVTVSTKTFNGKAGAAKLKLPKLKKGTYRVTLTPAGGKPRVLSLKVT